MIILSRGRSDNVTTVNILPDYIEMLVPESEKHLYEAKYPNPILTIPDDIMGLGRVRNWVLDNFKEKIIIMIDDDINKCYCISGLHARNIKDKDEMLQIAKWMKLVATDFEANKAQIKSEVEALCARFPIYE